MPKENLTVEELEERKKYLGHEIEALSSAIKACDLHAFDLMIAEIKRSMEIDIAEEDWKSLKQNQKKIEAFYQVDQVMESQKTLLKKKQEELAEIEEKLKYYQQNLDLDYSQKNLKTGIEVEHIGELEVGDVFEDHAADSVYYLIKQSVDMEGKFALISNAFSEERLLQYPANLKLLDDVCYIGNVFIEDDNQQKALDMLALMTGDNNEAGEETAEEKNAEDS